MADEIIRMEDIYADDIVGNINEVREARGTFESLDARLDNIGGGNAPSPSTSDPAMDGTASPGSADTYSRGDHVHPTDMSRQAVIDSSHKLSSDLVDDTNNTHKFATAAQLQQISTNEANISSILDGTTIDSFGDVESALADKVDKETGKGLSTNDYTTAEKTKLAGIAEGAEVNVQSNWTQTTTTADDYIKNKPTLGTAAAKNATDAYNATGTDVTTGKAVAAALATLPEPMVFKGSLGTGGTITSLPTASSSNKGYVYKVITAATYASQSAKVGDTFISDGSAWVLIPSGDEPSGTVTNVAVANGGGLTVSGSPIESSGTITIGHSNSVTAKTSSSLKKFTYDAYGHVTGSSELSTAESNALASGIDSTKVEQIETNKNNISTDEAALAELVDGGAKNIIQIFDVSAMTGIPTGITVVKNADNSVTFTGIATGGTGKVQIKIGTCYYSAGEFIIAKETLSGIRYFTGDNNFDSNNGNTHTYNAKGNTNIWLEFNFGTAYDNVTVYPMICTKAAWDISQTYQPYAMSNAELTAGISDWKSYDCLDTTHPNDIDINNSELTVYHNAFLKRVVISCKIKFLLQRTSASTALLIGNMGNIPNYTALIPLNSVREFVSTSDYNAFIAKNATNYAIAFAVNSGTLAANTEIRAQFEYTYF